MLTDKRVSQLFCIVRIGGGLNTSGFRAVQLFAIPPHAPGAIRLRELVAAPFTASGMLAVNPDAEPFCAFGRAADVPNLPFMVPKSIDAKIIREIRKIDWGGIRELFKETAGVHLASGPLRRECRAWDGGDLRARNGAGQSQDLT